MSHGSHEHGVDPWGDAFELGAAHLLYMLRMTPRWRAFADLVDARWSVMMAACDSMISALDIDTAVGDSLDVLGAILGREREGMTDARYRRALRVQRSLLSSGAGSSGTLIDVFAAWIGTAPLHYRNVAPAYAELGGIVPAADEHLLGVFLRAAAPAGVSLAVFAGTDEYLLGDSVANPIDDPGVVDCIADPVIDARVLPYEVI